MCVITSAHHNDDTRIYEKELLSISKLSNLELYYAAPGKVFEQGFNFISLGSKPSRRIYRFIKALVMPFKALIVSRAKVWHFHDPELIPFAIFLTFIGKKIIWDSHEDYFLQFDFKTQYRTYIPKWLIIPTNFLMNSLLKILDKRSYGIVAATEEIALKYKNIRRVVVGNESLNDNFSHREADFFAKNLLFIGPMSSQQNFRVLIDAVKDLHEVKLTVAGREDLIEAQYATSILGKRFEHVGWLNQSELGKLMSRSSIGLMTYFDSDLYKVLVSPTKFFEFVATGLPILATPTYANRQLIDAAQCGLVANGFDSKSLKEGIKAMLSSHEEWKNWSLNGKKWAQNFGSWEESRAALLSLYINL